MKVVIIGGGEVGFHVAKALSEEDYDITVVDIDPVKCRRASENLDVIVVEGNGASPNTLNFFLTKYLQIVDPSCPVAPKTKIFFLLIFFQ